MLCDNVSKLIPRIASMSFDMSPVYPGHAMSALDNVSKAAHQLAMGRKLQRPEIATSKIACIECIEMEMEMNVGNAIGFPSVVADLDCPSVVAGGCFPLRAHQTWLGNSHEQMQV